MKALADLTEHELSLVSENLRAALQARQQIRTKGGQPRTDGCLTAWANYSALMHRCLDHAEALLRDDPGTG